MEQNKIDTFLAMNREFLPASKIMLLKEQLKDIDDNTMMLLQSIQFKNPTHMLLFSIFLGSYGVDRFLLGDTAMGVLKLLTCGGCGIWSIIDWFLVQDYTREYNYKKITDILSL